MTQYRTYIDSDIDVGRETILGVQNDGWQYGIGISSDLRTENLYVAGVSTFVGNVTFLGGTNGTITIGDTSGDNVVFNADVNSSLIPNTDNLYDLGSPSQRWKNAYFSGSIGIGTTAAGVGCELEVIGTICATNFNSTSDIGLKTNLEKISDPLSKVLQLNGYTFNWKQTNQPSVGVVAQELEKVFPQLVGGFETKSVNYNGIIAVLIESIKELNQKVEDLTEEVSRLRMSE